jgi:uncharacterized protein with predicted RNA binding PUA domain
MTDDVATGGDGAETRDLSDLRTIADYQFGAGAGVALFPPEESPELRRTSTGRISQVIADDGRLVTLTTDGQFSLGLAGGRRLDAAFDDRRYTVVVGSESAPYVADGRNAFAKFVTDVDGDVRAGDEVLVVDGTDDDRLLAVGRAELAASATLDFETGMAVKVREGAAE